MQTPSTRHQCPLLLRKNSFQEGLIGSSALGSVRWILSPRDDMNLMQQPVWLLWTSRLQRFSCGLWGKSQPTAMLAAPHLCRSKKWYRQLKGFSAAAMGNIASTSLAMGRQKWQPSWGRAPDPLRSLTTTSAHLSADVIVTTLQGRNQTGSTILMTLWWCVGQASRSGMPALLSPFPTALLLLLLPSLLPPLLMSRAP